MLWTTRCIPLKCPWRQNLERRTFWTRYLCCNPKKNVWNSAKRQKIQYFEFYRFLVFWPTRCVPVPDPKHHQRLVTSSVAYLEAFWPKKLVYYSKIVEEQRVQAPHRNTYFGAFWPTWCIGVAGWILIFSQNEYDFRNQHPKNVQKQLVLAKVLIMSPPYYLTFFNENWYSIDSVSKFAFHFPFYENVIVHEKSSLLFCNNLWAFSSASLLLLINFVDILVEGSSNFICQYCFDWYEKR